MPCSWEWHKGTEPDKCSLSSSAWASRKQITPSTLGRPGLVMLIPSRVAKALLGTLCTALINGAACTNRLFMIHCYVLIISMCALGAVCNHWSKERVGDCSDLSWGFIFWAVWLCRKHLWLGPGVSGSSAGDLLCTCILQMMFQLSGQEGVSADRRRK